MKFVRVSRQHPCAICGKADWCGFSEDGVYAICMRVESPRPSKNGGWVHRLLDEPRPDYIPPPTPPRPRKSLFSPALYMDALRKAVNVSDGCSWQWNYVAADGFAAMLGVATEALEALGACWDASHDALAFPMRDGEGDVVGVRLRSMDGRKWAVQGSQGGLFYADAQAARRAYVCEGPTDAMALMSLDLFAVGRASCAPDVDNIRTLFRRLGVREVVIVSDNDKHHERGVAYPGLNGARRLAGELKLVHKIVIPQGTKDIRDWWVAQCRQGCGLERIRARFRAMEDLSAWKI